MTLAEVKTLYESNARQVTESARRLADNLATGQYGEVRSVAAVIEREDGSCEVFGWGDTGLLRTIGILTIGTHKLISMRDPNPQAQGPSAI